MQTEQELFSKLTNIFSKKNFKNQTRIITNIVWK